MIISESIHWRLRPEGRIGSNRSQTFCLHYTFLKAATVVKVGHIAIPAFAVQDPILYPQIATRATMEIIVAKSFG
jgi:hypothetical protein